MAFLSPTVLRSTKLVDLFDSSAEKSTDEVRSISNSSEVGMAITIARSILLSGMQQIKIISGELGSQLLLVSFKIRPWEKISAPE